MFMTQKTSHGHIAVKDVIQSTGRNGLVLSLGVEHKNTFSGCNCISNT